MRISILAIPLLLLTAPAALGHNPPAPVLTCQNTYLDGSGKYHEYLPPASGELTVAGDGNLENCPKPDPVEVGLLHPSGTECAALSDNGVDPGPPVCGSLNTGVDPPLWDYDGELDHGVGGAFLFVRTGDGVTDGVTACFGWPSVGHHTGDILVQDALGHGPRFTATSDFSRVGQEGTPECGDSFVEPCTPHPPPPSTHPFPANVVIDTANGALYSLFGPGGAGCNPLDNVQRFAGAVPGPSGGALGFGAGADGSVVVFVEHDADMPLIGTAGHIWTEVWSCSTCPPPPPTPPTMRPPPLAASVVISWPAPFTTNGASVVAGGGWNCVTTQNNIASGVVQVVCRPPPVGDWLCQNPFVEAQAFVPPGAAPTQPMLHVRNDCGGILTQCTVQPPAPYECIGTVSPNWGITAPFTTLTCTVDIHASFRNTHPWRAECFNDP